MYSMNAEIANVSVWFKSNKLSLNVDKTKWLLFHPNLLIENIHIKREHVTKLGVFISGYLSQKKHIDIVSNIISKSIGILYKSRDVLSQQCLKQLYSSFIHNYVNYGDIAWATTSKSKLERLYRCQNMLLVLFIRKIGIHMQVLY